MNYFLLSEVFMVTIFVVVLFREIFHKAYFRIYMIGSAFVFGVLLEVANIYISHTYSYSANFFMMFFGVPIFVGLAWAVIIYCASLLSDQYNIPWYLKPFFDSLTAILIDIALDVIAIRLGFWKWNIPLDAEWYGVPYGNFIGWILVVLVFSFIIRFIGTLNTKRLMTRILMVFTPILSYIGLIVGLIAYGLVSAQPHILNNIFLYFEDRTFPTINILQNSEVKLWQLILLILVVVELVNIVVWSLVKYGKRKHQHFDVLTFLISCLSYLFLLFIVIHSGLWYDFPIALSLVGLVFVAHVSLHYLPFLYGTPTVHYFWKKIERKVIKEEKVVEKLIEKNLR